MATVDTGDASTGAVRPIVVGIGASAHGVEALSRLRGEWGDAAGS